MALIFAADGGLASTGIAAVLVERGKLPSVINMDSRTSEPVPGSDTDNTLRRIDEVSDYIQMAVALWGVDKFDLSVVEAQVSMGKSAGTVKSAIGFAVLYSLLPRNIPRCYVWPQAVKKALGVRIPRGASQTVSKRLVVEALDRIPWEGRTPTEIMASRRMSKADAQHAYDAVAVALAYAAASGMWFGGQQPAP